jgi:hypothetical protein
MSASAPVTVVTGASAGIGAAVAVRLAGDDRIEVCAPLGLTDLLGGVWRRNPRRVSLDRSRARLARHRPEQRWPGVTVIPPG